MDQHSRHFSTIFEKFKKEKTLASYFCSPFALLNEAASIARLNSPHVAGKVEG